MDGIGGPAWPERVRKRLRSVEVDRSLSLVVEATVLGDESQVWHVVVADGRISQHDGPHPEPDLRLAADATTAAAIVDGTTAAARAFLDGRLRVEGDLTALHVPRNSSASRPSTT